MNEHVRFSCSGLFCALEIPGENLVPAGLPLSWLYTESCSAFVVLRKVDIIYLISIFGITKGGSLPAKFILYIVVVNLYRYTTKIYFC